MLHVDQTGLRLISLADVPGLLKQMLEQHHQGSVSLNDDLVYGRTSYRLTEEWLAKVWKGISLDNIKRYSNLPLLKSGTVLFEMNETSPYLLAGDLDSSMTVIAEKIGLILIRDTGSTKCRVISESWLAGANIEGFLRALMKVSHCEQRVDQLNDTEKRMLREYLRDVPHKMREESRTVLFSLPIFETAPTLTSQMKWASAKSVRQGIKQLPCVPLVDTCMLLDLSAASSRELASKLNRKVLPPLELYRDHLLPPARDYTDAQKNQLIMHILENYDVIAGRGDHSLQIKLCEFKSIPTTQGGHAQPMKIFDPEDTRLRALFQDSNLLPFPAADFQTPALLLKLRTMGMLGVAQLTPDDILHLAQYISTRVDETDLDNLTRERVVHQGRALTTFLDKNPDLLSAKLGKAAKKKSLKQKLEDLKFVPYLRQRPVNDSDVYPWFTSPHCLAAPSDVSTRLGLVDSMRPIVDGNYPNLETAFGWNSDPPIDDVIKQLENIIRTHSARTQPNILPKIYGFLQDHVDRPDLKQQLDALGEWVWTEGGFVSPDRVVLATSDSIDTRPYVFRNILSQSRLLKACGAQTTLDYGSVLRQIQNAHATGNNALANKERDLDLVMSIIRKLTASTNRSHSSLDVLEDLLIPIHTADGSLQLMSIHQCTFCDSDWLEKRPESR